MKEFLTIQIEQTLNAIPKIPYTPDGLAQVTEAIMDAFKRAAAPAYIPHVEPEFDTIQREINGNYVSINSAPTPCPDCRADPGWYVGLVERVPCPTCQPKEKTKHDNHRNPDRP